MDNFIVQAKAVADPTRLRMLKLLAGGELCVCEIMAVLGLGQSTASKHLNILKAAGLVESRKQGTWTYYRLARPRDTARDFLRLVSARLDGDATIAHDRKVLAKRCAGGCGAAR